MVRSKSFLSCLNLEKTLVKSRSFISVEKQQQCHELGIWLLEEQSKPIFPHWRNTWEERNWDVCQQQEQLETMRYIPNSYILHQLNTFHPNQVTKGWKNCHHFTEKDWEEVRNAGLVYNPLGWQTGICLHCILQASAKSMRVLSVRVPCWKRSACMSMSGQHQAQPSRESLSPRLYSLRHGPTFT